jgi:hypothetical protein
VKSVEARTGAALALSVASAGFSLGCASKALESSLPIYPLMSDQESLRIIVERQGRIASVSAQCEIVLTDAEGQRVNLDGVLLAMPLAQTGDRVRLRAWKLGQAVFDLTLVDGSAWLIAPENPRPGNQDEDSRGPSPNPPHSVAAPAETARRIAEALDFIGPRYFQNATVVGSSRGLLTVVAAEPRVDRTMCEIDRATLTPRAFISGGTGRDRADTSELSLSEYRLIGTIPWAHRLLLRGPGGIIDVAMSDVELNGELPANAFTPPARAKELR